MGRLHFKSNGKLLIADKTWRDLSEKQKNWITELIYTELNTNPDKTKHSKIVNVMSAIKDRQIWIPEKEIIRRFHQLEQRKQRRA